MNESWNQPETEPTPRELRDAARIDEATQGFSDEASGENADAAMGDDGFVYAAGALQRAESDALDVPADLREKLERDAEAFLDSQQRAHELRRRFAESPPSWMVFAGGALSMAAVMLLSLGLWAVFVSTIDPTPGDGAEIVSVEPERPEYAVSDWSGVAAGYEGVSGTVSWSDELQQGTMTFTGLPANDPAAGQYQLWIVDPTRDAEPVDGGVFDVVPDENGQATVAFASKLPVSNPTLFAITYEKPGGVVVSEGPLLATAAVKG